MTIVISPAEQKKKKKKKKKKKERKRKKKTGEECASAAKKSPPWTRADAGEREKKREKKQRGQSIHDRCKARREEGILASRDIRNADNAFVKLSFKHIAADRKTRTGSR